jgi:hypothetical protein
MDAARDRRADAVHVDFAEADRKSSELAQALSLNLINEGIC